MRSGAQVVVLAWIDRLVAAETLEDALPEECEAADKPADFERVLDPELLQRPIDFSLSEEEAIVRSALPSVFHQGNGHERGVGMAVAEREALEERFFSGDEDVVVEQQDEFASRHLHEQVLAAAVTGILAVADDSQLGKLLQPIRSVVRRTIIESDDFICRPHPCEDGRDRTVDVTGGLMAEDADRDDWLITGSRDPHTVESRRPTAIQRQAAQSESADLRA